MTASCAEPLGAEVALLQQIRQYISGSARLLSEMDARLRGALQREKSVVVWGTGQLTMKLLAQSVLGSAAIVAFIDGNPVNHGRTLRGVPILPPSRAAEFGCPIVVASTLHQRAISRTIREQLRLDNELILLADEQ
jgi:FlaA1/EpsC-like NDP-sugar epimerase